MQKHNLTSIFKVQVIKDKDNILKDVSLSIIFMSSSTKNATSEMSKMLQLLGFTSASFLYFLIKLLIFMPL